MIQANKVKVHNSDMHYITAGKGPAIVFLHGIPMSSTMWRDIMSAVSEKHQSIAPDLIGMGESDKPDIPYSLDDHIKYFEGFIEAIGLKHFTLVMHGWGSIIGLAYAMRHPDKISSIVFIESYLRIPKNLQEVPLIIQEYGLLLRDMDKLKKMILEENYLIEKIIPQITLKKFTEEELEVYRKIYHDPKSRQVLWQFFLELPFFNPQSPAVAMIHDYSKWLEDSFLPKLLLYAVPGFITTHATVEWATKDLPNLTSVELGHGLHYLPETKSAEISKALLAWL